MDKGYVTVFSVCLWPVESARAGKGNFSCSSRRAKHRSHGTNVATEVSNFSEQECTCLAKYNIHDTNVSSSVYCSLLKSHSPNIIMIAYVVHSNKFLIDPIPGDAKYIYIYIHMYICCMDLAYEI